MQRTFTDRQRHRRRAGVLAGATLCFSLSGSLAAHADDGLLGGATEVVGEATQQVPPVVETVQSAVPEPVEQVVAPVVAPVAPPADAPSDAERVVEEVVDQAVDEAVTAVEQPPAPAGSAPEPVVAPAEPLVQPDAGPPVGAADHAGGEDRGRHGHRASRPREVNRPATLRHDDEDVEEEAGRLWQLTYDLMRLSAGQHVPGAVDAGLAGGGPTGTPAPGAAATPPLLLGLVLACVSLVLARRRLG